MLTENFKLLTANWQLFPDLFNFRKKTYAFFIDQKIHRLQKFFSYPIVFGVQIG